MKVECRVMCSCVWMFESVFCCPGSGLWGDSSQSPEDWTPRRGRHGVAPKARRAVGQNLAGQQLSFLHLLLVPKLFNRTFCSGSLSSEQRLTLLVELRSIKKLEGLVLRRAALMEGPVRRADSEPGPELRSTEGLDFILLVLIQLWHLFWLFHVKHFQIK